MNSLSISQIPQIPSTISRTNPHIYTTSTFSTLNTQNTLNIPPSSNVNYHTMPSSTVSIPTYKNYSASISGSIKPFDCLDHKYTFEDYLENIEARVLFSLGLQPSTEQEIKFWHARRI